MQSIDSLKNKNGEIEREDIKKIIPYEDPFLMIDKIIYLDKKKIIAIKDVKSNESWTKGHFVNFPIMPGALIIEALGQAATLLVRYNLENHENYDVLAYKIGSAKFFRPTFPGHRLRFEAKLLFRTKKISYIRGRVFRKEKLVSKSNIVLAVVDKRLFRERYQKPKDKNEE